MMPDPVPQVTGWDASPPPPARADGFIEPSPNLPSSSDDEVSSGRQAIAAPRASRQPQRPTAASRSASQPIAAPSAKEVYLDSDSDLLLLTT